MSKVLVLGATGMLGAYSSIALARAGHRVTAVSRRESDNGFFEAYGIPYLGGWELASGDTYRKLPTDVDAVVNMAGYMPAHGDASAMPYVRSIVEGTVFLCEWMRTQTKCRRILFNTTPADVAAHRGSEAIADDAPRSFPKDGGDHAVYAICKIAATDLLEHYQIAYQFRPCVFRHMTVFGWHPNATYHVNGRNTISPWRLILRRSLHGEPVEIWGDPKRRSELLYVDDFTRAIQAGVESDACGLFNLPGVRPYTLEEEFQTLIDVFSPEGKPSQKIYRPEKPVAPETLLRGEKAREALGWVPRVEWRDACMRIREEMRLGRFEKLWGPMDEEDRAADLPGTRG